MLCEDAQQLAGMPHSRYGGRVGHRWGRTKGKIGFHGGKVAVGRPRVRGFDGHELSLPTWTAAQAEDWLGRWAMNLMLINVSTCKLRRAVRLPEDDLPAVVEDGTSKSAASRRFVALSADRLAEWMASDLSKLDLLVIQIDGLHIGNDLVLVAALGIDADGRKHPLALVEGATENAAVVGADRQSDRARARPEGLPAVHHRRCQGAEHGHSSDLRCPHTDPAVPDLQGSQRDRAGCQSCTRRSAERCEQAWELDDADKAERLLRNLARRLDQEAPGVAASILEGLDEMLTFVRVKPPMPCGARSPAPTRSRT